ncbi:phosphotransferase family protein [Nocardioides panzhihuensis]|uniref:Aminoglycoside phosphotransferase (APT) family kinase protein n=1 Tax=Nocardioides panzhihuensis TaxID=860243 RepID=A0A7Z0DHP1_9ACTN|nr:phosphotransferase family protein [Nocardioides panzhihuensis]NYI75540.1 aminoglycoside phosphotransferase (APT) family kinase protein [Nocardioides panzhihuensis]
MDELLAGLRLRLEKAVAGWSPTASVVGLEPLTGGSSSLTFIAELAGAEHERVVVKMAPPGLPPVRNRDVLRQSRLMRALESAPQVLITRSLVEVEADSLEAPPFFAMDLVPGECVEPTLERHATRPSPKIVEARAYDAARALAALHTVEPSAVGLGGEVAITIADEIQRWHKAFTTVPAEFQGEFERGAQLLYDTAPAGLAPVIVHGDYRLGNVLCLEGRVTAIIDWEIWALGDPRTDVTWLTFFTDEGAHPAAEPGPPAGMPGKKDLIAAYEAHAGHRLPDMDWFDALTKYKEAAATALLLKRAIPAGELPPPMARMVEAVPRLVTESIAAIS